MVSGANRVRLLCLVTAWLGVFPLLNGAEDFASLLRQAVASHKQGKLAEATEFLLKAQELSPGDAEVAELLATVYETELDRIDSLQKDLVRMAADGELKGTPQGLELARVARQILRKTGEAQKRYTRDDEEIAKIVDRIFGERDNLGMYLRLVQLAEARHGRYLVPHYLIRLGDQEPSIKLTAFRALVSLGRDAVVPLIVALDSESGPVREQIALILGRIGDPTALSTLVWAAEMDSDQNVRAMAKEALKNFTGRGELAGEPWRLLLNDAIRFIRGTARLPRRQYAPWVWRFKEGKLVGEQVAAFQAGRMHADVFLTRSTKAALKAEEPLPWAVFVANRAGQVRLYRENLALMKAGGGDEALIALLEGQATEIERMAQSVRRAGLTYMTQGLRFALQELEQGAESPAAALELVAEIRRQGRVAAAHARAMEALGTCLDSRNQLVRFEAAVALADIRPPLGAETALKTVDNLALAVAEPGARVALVVSPDDDVRARFTALLDQGGFLALAVDSALTGLAEAAMFPPKHVVFFDSDLDQGVRETINYLRATKVGASLPVVIISSSGNERRDRDLYEKPEQKVQVVVDAVGLEELRTAVLDPIVAQAQDTRAEGEERAARAAQSLLGLLADRVSWVPGDLDALASSAVTAAGDTNRVSGVREPACLCAGFVGGEAALKTLSEVVKYKENPAAVRVAGLKAAGDILQRLSLSLEAVSESTAPGLDEILQECLVDDDPAVRAEAARAMGKAVWQPEIFLNVEAKTGPFTQ
jgi:HEAT repeat protein